MSKKAEEERVASEAAVLAPAIKSEKAAAPKTGSKLPSKAAVSKFLVFSVFALFIFFCLSIISSSSSFFILFLFKHGKRGAGAHSSAVQFLAWRQCSIVHSLTANFLNIFEDIFSYNFQYTS